MNLTDLPTAAAILDRARFTRNCTRMLERVRAMGTRLRPHMKTMKSIDAARVAIDPRHGGIAVATLNEAEYFAASGITDICYAVCMSPDKAARAAPVAARAPGFSAFVDDVETVRALGHLASGWGLRFNVWIEIDSGEHRTGVDPESAALLEVARGCAQSRGIRLMGIATHAGHSYSGRSVAELQRFAEQERSLAVGAAERVRAVGIECPGVSVGSTPTTMNALSAEGITEWRAGVYMAGDLFQSGIGSCGEEDIAVSVLATVISRRASAGHVVIDAGGLALSKDRSTAATSFDVGYGRVRDMRGERSLGDVVVCVVHQEHGQLSSGTRMPMDQLPVGARVRVLPNHVCMTAAMYDRFYVVDGPGLEVVAVWERTNGW